MHFFNLKKSGAKLHHLFVEVSSKAALSETSYREWFYKSKNGKFDVKDKECRRTASSYEDAEWEA